MPLADWTVPFELTSAPFDAVGTLPFNQDMIFPSGVGRYVLVQEGCKLRADVRATKTRVPQEDGDLLHRRFVTGCEMDLRVSFWEGGSDPPERPACDELLQEMSDEFMGYAYGLLNAGDNEGRIQWLPSGAALRMLDDIRLWKYPAETKEGGQAFELAMTVDCGRPYSEDVVQDSTSLSGGAGTVPNTGTRSSYPVWKIYGPFTAFTLSDGDDEFIYNSALSGAVAVANGDYLEINTFRNTVFLNGSGANRMPGIVMTTSKFFLIPPGGSSITIVYTGGGAGNASSLALTNNAWA